jgi:alanine dehydrogenase
MTLILANDDVDKLITVKECIDALEPAYVELAGGKGINRTRSDSIIAHRSQKDAVYGLKSMDGVVPSLGVGAVRINSDVIAWPVIGNAQRRTKIPAAKGRWVGLVLLFSTEDGAPLAIMPDGVMQRIRVAAANGIGVKYMARENASDVAIIGTGWQAGTQLEAAYAVRNVRRIRCWSPNGDNRAKFAREMSTKLGMAVEPMADPESTVKGADIVLCATSSIDPVYFARWLEPGVHLSSIKKAEIENAALKRCQSIAVHVHEDKPLHFVEEGADAADAEVAKGWAEKDGIDFSKLPTVADLIGGKVKGRARAEDMTAFLNNIGMGYQFAVAGAVVYRKAMEKGVGRDFPTDWFTQDVHP